MQLEPRRNLRRLRRGGSQFGSRTPQEQVAAAPAAAADYQVRSGDTLSAIARQHGMSLGDLIGKNSQISNPNNIAIGQKIKL